MRLLNRLGVSRFFNFYTRMQMRSSSGAGLIVAPSYANHDCLTGGEALQRLWLTLSQKGIAFQPMDATAVFLMHLHLNGGSYLSGRQRDQIKMISAEFNKLFGIRENNGLILLFRVGFSKSIPAKKSLRRPLKTFLLPSRKLGTVY